MILFSAHHNRRCLDHYDELVSLRVLVTIARDGRGRQQHSGQGKCPVLHGRGGGSFLHLVLRLAGLV